MKFVFSARALRHLIAQQSFESRADAYIERIDTFCQGLASFPERGSTHDDVLPGLRMIGFERSTTIVFCVGDNEVIIEGVLCGGRSIDTMLGNKK